MRKQKSSVTGSSLLVLIDLSCSYNQVKQRLSINLLFIHKYQKKLLFLGHVPYIVAANDFVEV